MAVQLLSIDQDILDSARLTVDEAKVELAVYLYSQRRLSIGKARELAGMLLWTFRQLLASRQIPPHYDEEDLLADVKTLRALRLSNLPFRAGQLVEVLVLGEESDRKTLTQELASLFKETQALPQVQQLTEEEIEAEIAAYRSGE